MIFYVCVSGSKCHVSWILHPTIARDALNLNKDRTHNNEKKNGINELKVISSRGFFALTFFLLFGFFLVLFYFV